jgi:penicillin-binding protein 1A
MSVENYTQRDGQGDPAPIVIAPHERRRPRRRRAPRPPRPRVRKRRLLFVLTGFGALAVISMLFGALTSIASDLPKFRSTVQFSKTVDSYMYDATGTPIGPLAPASTPAIDHFKQISPNMVNAIVSVEDRGFWRESGISVRGLARAALADATGGKIQGASTIPEEFIKNVRQEEGDRSVAEKLVEAGMAFQLSHHWKHVQILTAYLNSIYFGNGALGIEAAARTYFGWAHGYDAADPADGGKNSCGNADPGHASRPECASVLTPAEAALLAAMVANPTAFNPITHPQATLARRNEVVLKDMYEQHYLTYTQFVKAESTPLPTAAQIKQPQQQPGTAPYFTDWVEPQVVRALEHEGLGPKQAQYEADYGGLKITLSIDLNLQNEAQQAIDRELPANEGLPTASLVAIDNKTGEVRAMVSGESSYQQSPFNLATLGYRQPGSSFKLFTLAAALSEGKITPYSDEDSKPITIHWFYKNRGNAVATPNGTGRFTVHNFGNVYSGLIPMTVATATSDNSVFAQLGTSIGTGPVAKYAKLLGIRSSLSRNPSMILGGLSKGVSALDMAHAYSTVANGGKKVYNTTLGDVQKGPIGIDSISNCAPCHQHNITNARTMTSKQVITPDVAATITDLLHGPVDDSYGTGTAAAIPGVDVAGKTGTTSNYVDAWFVGYTPSMTVAVWVGYPNTGKPMSTLFDGGPVEGGTYPAIIWHNYVVGALQILQDEADKKTGAAATVTSQLSTNTYSSTSSSTGTSTATTQTAPTTTSQTYGTNNGDTSNSSSGAANQTETLPQTTSPPPASSGTPTTGSNGGTGL